MKHVAKPVLDAMFTATVVDAEAKGVSCSCAHCVIESEGRRVLFSVMLLATCKFLARQSMPMTGSVLSDYLSALAAAGAIDFRRQNFRRFRRKCSQ